MIARLLHRIAQLLWPALIPLALFLGGSGSLPLGAPAGASACSLALEAELDATHRAEPPGPLIATPLGRMRASELAKNPAATR